MLAAGMLTVCAEALEFEFCGELEFLGTVWVRWATKKREKEGG
jgi:hypothetical protein